MSGQQLPDELWTLILNLGIRNSNFSYKDLCCISITCRRLRRLSGEDSLWSHLLSSDFPFPPQNPSTSSSPPPAKSTYRLRFERERERRVAAQRRAVLRKESQVLEHERRLREIDKGLQLEAERMRCSVTELGNLQKVRQASVALNVWQPEVVRGRQLQIVEQSVVPMKSRVHSLEMELKLCKQQIASLNKAHRDEKRRLDKAKKELASLKYHPLQDYKLTASGENERDKKRKRKLKTCLNILEKDVKTL